MVFGFPARRLHLSPLADYLDLDSHLNLINWPLHWGAATKRTGAASSLTWGGAPATRLEVKQRRPSSSMREFRETQVMDRSWRTRHSESPISSGNRPAMPLDLIPLLTSIPAREVPISSNEVLNIALKMYSELASQIRECCRG